MAKRPNIVTSIRVKRDDNERSLRWYRKQIQTLVTTKVKMRNDIRKEAVISTNMEIGKLYLYKYDPKWKDILPVYDTYPLVFPFNYAKGGFLGINLHYLPYNFRFYLIQSLEPLLYGRTTAVSKKNKAKLSWEILTKIAGVGSLNNAVKHYLTDHMRSAFMEIRHEDWFTAANLPIENFVYNN